MKRFKAIAVSMILMFSGFANAGLIFTFDLGGVTSTTSNQFAAGDSVSIEFVSDTNFLTGITASDIVSISVDIASIGAYVADSPLAGHVYGLDNLFSFTSLSGAQWLLELTVGNGFAGNSELIYDLIGGGLTRAQFTQNSYNALYFSNNGLAATTDENYTLSATTASVVAVPEPGLIGLFALSILFVMRIKRS